MDMILQISHRFTSSYRGYICKLFSLVKVNTKLIPTTPYTKFQPDWRKYVTTENFVSPSTQFKMAEDSMWQKLMSKGALKSAWSEESNYVVFLKFPQRSED